MTYMYIYYIMETYCNFRIAHRATLYIHVYVCVPMCAYSVHTRGSGRERGQPRSHYKNK